MTAIWGGGGLYQTWASFLERWAAGERLDSSSLPALRVEDFAGDTWSRLADRLTDALNRRLVAWAASLTNATAEARDEFGVARALANARLGLTPVRALATHAGLPPDLAKRLLAMVNSQVDSAQKSLEAEVDRMRRGGVSRDVVEGRLRTIRDNSLTAVSRQAAPPATATRPDAWYVDPSAPSARRIVVNRPPKST